MDHIHTSENQNQRILKKAIKENTLPTEELGKQLQLTYLPQKLQATDWNEMFKMLRERGKKKKSLKPRILYPVKFSFQKGGEIRTFSNKN